MDELLAQFLIEGRDLIAQASADLMILSRNPDAAPTIDSAFRAMHTLKGSVGIFPMGPAERVLHAAEDVLERARKGAAALDGETVAGLTSCLDAVDRWIDDIERSGEVDGDAHPVAAAILERLSRTTAVDDVADEGWAAAGRWAAELVEREAAMLASATAPLVAFRYVPDAECFFRGDDPLAIVGAVPELLALAIRPVRPCWPSLGDIEPFQCISLLEGLSGAALEDVKAVFRLVPDQVQLHLVERRDRQPTSPFEVGAGGVLRVEAGRIDALADGLSELIVAANALKPIVEDAARLDRRLAARLRAAQEDIEGRIGNLSHSVSRVRLVPLAPTFRRLPRMIREIASGLGKQVTFSVSGETIEVDKRIADALFEPLLHLARNAIDHGIEDGAVRVAAGKPAAGTVALTARRDGDAILVTLSDDGAGIDPARLRTAAVARGMLTAAAADELSDVAALRLIFAAGFSTARRTTEISGRGIGMDAVRAAIETLRGTIEIDSTVGAGARFHLRLPANALTTRLLVVKVGEDRYGVALDQIVETVRIEIDELIPVGGGLACVLRGRTVPVLNLATLLGGEAIRGANAKLLVTRAGGERVALRVDGFAERLDTVVRPPIGLLAAMPGVSGSALLGDGGVLLVLDLPALAA